MATVQFPGSGTISEAFNINHTLVNKTLLPGEERLRTPFPFPMLDSWRQTALQHTAVTPTTGSSDIATRGRTTLLFAHEADMIAFFFNLTKTDYKSLTGYYIDKAKTQTVDQAFNVALTQKNYALQELEQQLFPKQYINLISIRLNSQSFNHRVTGVCAAVYLSGLILTDNNK